MLQKREDELRFQPTSGRGTGILAVLGALAVVVGQVMHPDGTPLWAAPAAVLLGVLAWASLLWPRLSIEGDELVLRNMLETVRVPLAAIAIEGVVVRQFLAVWADGKRYVSPTVGKPWRTTLRSGSGLPTTSRMSSLSPLGRMTRTTTSLTGDIPTGGVSYVEYVEQTINDRVELAKRAKDSGLLPNEQVGPSAGVRREPAWVPIGLIVASALALLISILL